MLNDSYTEYHNDGYHESFPSMPSRDVKAEAEVYFKFGLNIIPTHQKISYDKWEQWQSQRQTKEEFESLQWEDADSFAVICGTSISVNGETLYFAALDFDHPPEKFKPDFDLESKNGIKTYVEYNAKIDPKDGEAYINYHFYYLSPEPVQSRKLTLTLPNGKSSSFEIKGAKSYICIYGNPVFNEPLKSLDDLKIEQINVTYQNLAEKMGFLDSKTSKLLTPKKRTIRKRLSKEQMEAMLQEPVEEGNRNATLFNLTRTLRDNGLTREESLELMNQWNLSACKSPLPERELEATVNSVYTQKPMLLDKEKFDRKRARKEVAEALRDKYSPLTLLNGYSYLYIDNRYKKCNVEVAIKPEVIEAFDSLDSYEMQDSKEIADRLKGADVKEADYFQSYSKDHLNLIPLSNGILNLDTLELKPHSPEYPFTIQLPVEYNPNAQCPIIDKALHTWVSPDQESEDLVQTIYELIGYCMYRRLTIQKLIIFLGNGDNGKTVCTQMIRAFLGKENLRATPLQQLRGNFIIANLEGKLANIPDELSDEALQDISLIKSLTGGGNIDGNVKFQQEAVNFDNYAKIICPANLLPRCSEMDKAFLRRLIIVPFNNIIPEAEKDEHFIDKVTTKEELSGLLNKAIEGLQRLLKNHRFSYQPNIDETQDQYLSKLEEPDKFMQWVQDTFEPASKDEYLTGEEILELYREFTGEVIKDETTFKTDLTNCIKGLGWKVEKRQRKVNGKIIRVYAYIRRKGASTTSLLLSNIS